MTKFVLGLVMMSSISAFAGQCFIVTYENGSSLENISRNGTTLKTCMKKAALTLQDISDKKNPTVKVYHPKIPGGMYLRKEDGKMINSDL